MSKSIQRSSSAVSAQDGRYIFAYCNIRTNQILYSLHRKLKDSALRQLPDMGANNNPPTIRKDLWKPLWTLVYDKSSQGYRHGLRAFVELKDYRILHDYNTKPPADNGKWPSRERREELQEMLDRRGGSKITTVGKLIAREKKKARARAIMDQKANSIADLAAVLMKQERQTGPGRLEEREWADIRRDEIALMVEQADRPMEFIERLKPTLARIAGSMHSKASGPKVDGRLTNSPLESAQLSIIRAIKSIKASSELVTQARARLRAASELNQNMTEEQKASKAAESDRDAAKPVLEQRKRRRGPKPEPILNPLTDQPSDEIQGTLTPEMAVALRLNAGFPRPNPAAETVSADPSAMQWQKVEGSIMSAKTLDELQSAVRVIAKRGRGAEIYEAVTALQSSGVMASASESETRETDALELARYIPSPALASIPDKDLPKDVDERKRLSRAYVRPNFTKGARVQWQDVLDAEFAECWPKDVRHTSMGIVGNEAPDPLAPVFMDTIDYSERVACQSEYKRLVESEALEAEGKHEQARKLRESITMVRKNEHGEYELIKLEDRHTEPEIQSTEASAEEDNSGLRKELANA